MMKRLNNIISTLSLALIIWGPVFAQNNHVQYDANRNHYRVVAVKEGDVSVKSYSNTVEVAVPLTIYAPNAFSPDNDGINDFFKVEGKGIEEFTLEVYNRWGELIFASADQSEEWDGTYRGSNVPMGSYVYQVKGRSADGNNHIVKAGTIALVR